MGNPADLTMLEALARRIRRDILTMSTEAASGHPTSSLSAVELMTALYFGGVLRYDLDNPDHPNNDRVIFSKGHASPLFYALYAAAGKLSAEDLKTYRQLGSTLEGHARPNFRYTEAATGSLGQGLAIGVGMAWNARYLDKLSYRTFVLLGDSEMAEGSNWEAIEHASQYGLSNLVGIIDVNRLGQRGQTMLGHHTETYAARLEAFGWQALVVDGHDLKAVLDAFATAEQSDRPTMIIAKTLKGKGVSFWEDKEEWHGKPLPEAELAGALAEVGEVAAGVRGVIAVPAGEAPAALQPKPAALPTFAVEEQFSTREAYGQALAALGSTHPDLVVLDAEVSNSTMAQTFKQAYPERFFEAWIAEQGMVGVAQGLYRRGKRPFVSTFAAFFARAFDQIRMSQYSEVQMVFAGSHAGVSIGPDGPSQMALEDLALFRSVGATVLYPSDATSAAKLTELAATNPGITYLRTTRGKTPVLYGNDETFTLGGSKTLRSSPQDTVTIISAGITLHEALAAADALAPENIAVRVIDLYSVAPLDITTLQQAAAETSQLITVEDHKLPGGIGESVKAALSGTATPITCLTVTKTPGSATPEEQLAFQGIDAAAIVKVVRKLT